MAGFALGINRALLPWKRAGVEYLLCEEADIQGLRALCRTAATPAGTAPSVSARRAADRQAAPAPAVNAFRNTPAETCARSAHAPAGRPPMPASAPKQPARSPAGTAARAAASSELVLPLERWPESWKRLLEKTARTPLLLWSYPELRDDLSGRGSHERGNALRRLFADLRLPRGSHAFWPLAPLYGPEETAEQPGMICDGRFFHSGVRVLRPRTVLLLCEQVPKTLCLPEIGIMQSVIHGGVRFVQLHGVDQLAEDMQHRPARHTQLVQFLRTLCQ